MADRLVVGQGYVGLPLAMRAVDVGFDVFGFDVDASKVKQLAASESIVEDISNECLSGALGTGRYLPTDDVADCVGFDFAVASVPTPLHEGNPDLSYIEDAARSVGRCLRPGATVVLESTTYPGTTEELFGLLLEETSGLLMDDDFYLGYSSERIDPGNTTWRFEHTPRVVSGIDEASLAKVQGFFGRLVDRTVELSTPKEAGLTKLLENTFRHVNIALVNDVNDHMPDYVVRRLVVGLNREAKAIRGSRILLLGLSYKKNTGNARESPSHHIARQLLALGANLAAADPHVFEVHAPPGIPRPEATVEELAADVVILLVDHDEFDYDAVANHASYVLDTNRRLPPAANVAHSDPVNALVNCGASRTVV